MGKGLGIKEQGHYVAFVAGTGVLVFVDLVAFLIRLNLGLLNGFAEKIIIKEKFKFTLYVSFANEADSIAMDLLEGLKIICEK